jgi:two-component system OmpR family response regulator
MKTIAMIDDDEYIGNMLEELLHKENYMVLRAYSGTEALLLLSQHRPDLILLDLMLPGLPGEEVLPQIKDIPVIVISAKLDVQHKVKLLLGGAVDYLTKPFDTRELLARITVQLRNNHLEDIRSITAGDLEIDTLSKLLHVKGVPVRLTKTEYAIFKLLMMNPSQIISKSTILDRISLDTPDCMESSLKVHISNLRKKLRCVCDKEYIEVIWGIGYRLSEA